MITSNHDVILGDSPRNIVIDADGNVTKKFEKKFKIDGKDSGASAMLWVCVKGLVGDAEPLDVDINGSCIGRLMPNTEASPNSWFTQMLHFSASEGSLNPNAKSDETANTIQIPGAESKGKEGKVQVQNIVILYKAIIDEPAPAAKKK